MSRWIVSLLLFLGWSNALPIDSLNMRFVGNWPFGSIQSQMCGTQNLIFLAEGGGVFVFDAGSLEKLSEIHMYHPISEMYLYSSRLFLYDGNLAIWDVSDPDHPVLVSKFYVEQISGIAADSTHLYLASPYGSFRIYDISNPATPTLISNTNLGGFSDIEVCGNSILALDYWNGKIYKIDISNPTSPYVATSTSWSSHSATRICYPGGSYAYIAGGEDGLVIVDVSNPDTLIVQSITSSVAEAVDLAISGNRAFVAVAWYGLKVLDVSNASSPHMISSIDIGNAESVIAMNFNVALLTVSVGNHDGIDLISVNIQDTSNPTSELVKILPGISYNVAFRDQYAFLATGLGGIRILDISSPEHIREVSTYTSPDTEMYDVKVKNNILYIADNHGLRALDISNPLAPQTIYHSPDLEVWQSRLYVDDSLLLLVAPLRGLFIFDISNPSDPVLAGSLNTLVRPNNTALSGNYAIVADWGEWWGGGGLKFIDLSTPSNPVEDTVLPGRYYDVEVSGDFAYVTIQYGVTAVDIQNIHTPQPLDSLHLGGEIGGVGVHDTLIAATSDNMDAFGVGVPAVVLINVRDPENMNIVGYYELPDGDGVGTPGDVEFYQAYTFVATNRLGLNVYEYTPTSVSEDRAFPVRTSPPFATLFSMGGHLKHPLMDAEIYSVTGQKILTVRNSKFIHLPTGIYLVVQKGKPLIRLVIVK